MKTAQISVPLQGGQNPRHLCGGLDCVTALHAGVTNLNPTVKKQKLRS